MRILIIKNAEMISLIQRYNVTLNEIDFDNIFNEDIN